MSAGKSIGTMELDNDDFDVDFDPSVVQRLPWLETPLAAETNCIRLLKLDAGSGDDPVVGTLQVVSLDDNPDYEALSYVCALAEQIRLNYLTIGNRYGVLQARRVVSSSAACASKRHRI